MNKGALLSIGFLCSLIACDSTSVKILPDNKPTNAVPRVLRAIPTSQLTAEVLLNGLTTIYNGRDYPDGNWTISLPVPIGEEHIILIKWRASGTLVMEQYGSFVAEITDPPIVLDLNPVSRGAARFDVDCDGTTNLDEILAGSDPAIATDPAQDGCNTNPMVPENPDELVPLFLNQTTERFDDPVLGTPRVTRFSQPIRVQNINADTSSVYGVRLFTNGGSKISEIELFYDPTINRRQVRMSDPTAISLNPAGLGECDSEDKRCIIEFDWKEQHWYELVVEEDVSAAGTIWKSLVVDTETGVETLVATAETEPEVVWVEALYGQANKRSYAASLCVNGISATTAHYQGGIVNNIFRQGMPNRTNNRSGCSQVGGGGSTDVLYEDGSTIYSQTIGR